MTNFVLNSSYNKALIGIALFFVILVGGSFLYKAFFVKAELNNDAKNEHEKIGGESNEMPISTPVNQESLEKDNDYVDIINDFLTALESIYFASTYTDVELDTFQIDSLTNLIRQNDLFERGLVHVSDYIDHEDQAISTVAQGITQGTKQVIEANDTLISYLRSEDVLVTEDSAEVQYQFASYFAAQKKGYELIFLSTPFLTYAMIELTDDEGHKGEIPYKVTSEERMLILTRIDQLFGEGLKGLEEDRIAGRDMNAVLLGLEEFRNNIMHNTFEEAALAAP